MEKIDRIHQLIPSIDQIKDEQLRNGVIEIWCKVWEDSGWKDLTDCPFNLSLSVEECNLIQHTNFVTSVALAMGQYARDIWGMQVDTDLILAGALLHDVSKAMEVEPKEEDIAKKSEIGKNLLHGAYGVHLVLSAGLPLKVAHLISSHTPRVSQLPDIVEGVFISYADYAAADAVLLKKGLPLLLKRHLQ